MASLSQGRTAAAQCGLFTHKSVPVIFEPPCISHIGCEYKVPVVILSHVLTCNIRLVGVNSRSERVLTYSNCYFRIVQSTLP